jgi:predicted O-methyltransferase YrrM
VDAAGDPIPWYTYPAIAFLARVVSPDLEVFEFGSGNSTLWWAARVASVTTVEHDAEWADEMRPLLPANVAYSHVPLAPDARYAKAAKATGRQFDVIVVDGKDRVRCTRRSLAALKPEGVIVLDNADRPKFARLLDELESNEFKRLPFAGHGPIEHWTWETAILYRSGNCLGI